MSNSNQYRPLIVARSNAKLPISHRNAVTSFVEEFGLLGKHAYLIERATKRYESQLDFQQIALHGENRNASDCAPPSVRTLEQWIAQDKDENDGQMTLF